jgi:hypothetical protein
LRFAAVALITSLPEPMVTVSTPDPSVSVLFEPLSTTVLVSDPSTTVLFPPPAVKLSLPFGCASVAPAALMAVPPAKFSISTLVRVTVVLVWVFLTVMPVLDCVIVYQSSGLAKTAVSVPAPPVTLVIPDRAEQRGGGRLDSCHEGPAG